MMTLLTPRIIQALPPLQSTAHIPLEDKTIISKFYLPEGQSWYVFEGEVDAQKGYQFFGLVVDEGKTVNQACLGYFYLSDLVALIEEGSPVQLDTTVFNASYNDVLKKVVAATHPLCRPFLYEKIVRALPAIGSTEHIPLEEKTLICGFHRLYGPVWYVFEGELTMGDYRFFGMIEGAEREWGYFYLSELVEIYSTDIPIAVGYTPAFNVRYGDIFARSEKV